MIHWPKNGGQGEVNSSILWFYFIFPRLSSVIVEIWESIQ